MLSNALFFSDTFEATYMFICKLGLRFTKTICLFYKMLNLQKKSSTLSYHHYKIQENRLGEDIYPQAKIYEWPGRD